MNREKVFPPKRCVWIWIFYYLFLERNYIHSKVWVSWNYKQEHRQRYLTWLKCFKKNIAQNTFKTLYDCYLTLVFCKPVKTSVLNGNNLRLMLGPFSFLSNPHALKLYWIWAWKIPCNQTQCVWPWNEKERCLNAKITIRQWMRGMFSLHTAGCSLRLPGLGNLCSGTPQFEAKSYGLEKLSLPFQYLCRNLLTPMTYA